MSAYPTANEKVKVCSLNTADQSQNAQFFSLLAKNHQCINNQNINQKLVTPDSTVRFFQ